VAHIQTTQALSVQGLVKHFGPIIAVDGLNLEVPLGTCVGLLGPNGAGKSTTMKMLTGQVIPDSGTLEVLGYTLPSESKQARAQMGVVPQMDNLDNDLSVYHNLVVFAYLYQVENRDVEIEKVLKIANLFERKDSKVKELSGGMRRRLLIARSLMHKPKLMLLDEPTVGLDPQVRQELWAFIDNLRSEGTSILMSTHYIEEAERLCDSVTIMSHGKKIAEGAPHKLILEHAGTEVVEVYGPPATLKEIEESAKQKGLKTRRTGTSIAVIGKKGEIPFEGLIRAPNLEDVFVLLTGEQIE